MFTLIEADRSKAPFAHAAVPSDASAFFLDGGFVCEREPDLIFFFPGNLHRQIPHLKIESHYWEFTGRAAACMMLGNLLRSLKFKFILTSALISLKCSFNGSKSAECFSWSTWMLNL